MENNGIETGMAVYHVKSGRSYDVVNMTTKKFTVQNFQTGMQEEVISPTAVCVDPLEKDGVYNDDGEWFPQPEYNIWVGQLIPLVDVETVSDRTREEENALFLEMFS